MRLTVSIAAFAALASVAAAGAASAAVSDADFIRASRCKGIATGLGVDAADLSAFVKAEGRTRLPVVSDQAAEAEMRANKAAAKAESKTRFETELSGVCAAYVSAPKAVAAR